MEILIAFLLDNGGIFGLLFLLSLVYIWWAQVGKKGEKEEGKKEVITKIDNILSELVNIKTRLDSVEHNLNTGRNIEIEHDKNTDKVYDSVEHINSLVKDLWDWHSIKDVDGIPVWYVKRSLEDKIKGLSDTIKIDADRLAQHSKDIAKLNEGRIEELKEVITNYNKTIFDLTMALERVRMTLDAKGA